ncbi:hypothetical protein [Mycolicibacterium mengxianglii]|uniref:hypothetical protein n=1 Tax=Mycolicibacterium mengxianglii TaxID=2736649 RepID=UPI0018D1A065|nr:hypothetical protein [Mycolicibacterium mengxianglii]
MRSRQHTYNSDEYQHTCTMLDGALGAEVRIVTALAVGARTHAIAAGCCSTRRNTGDSCVGFTEWGGNTYFA